MPKKSFCANLDILLWKALKDWEQEGKQGPGGSRISDTKIQKGLQTGLAQDHSTNQQYLSQVLLSFCSEGLQFCGGGMWTHTQQRLARWYARDGCMIMIPSDEHFQDAQQSSAWLCTFLAVRKLLLPQGPGPRLSGDKSIPKMRVYWGVFLLPDLLISMDSVEALRARFCFCALKVQWFNTRAHTHTHCNALNRSV